MISCKHCATHNSLDSTFCRRCGTPLPEEDLKAAQAKLDELVAEGVTAYNEGRTDEAMAVAESALLSNPSSVMALTLMADCLARKGEVARALECAERIVELNPESELDKIKRNQLRNQLASSLRLPDKPDRRLAMTAAAAAVILVVSLGVIVSRLGTDAQAQQVAQLDTPTNVPAGVDLGQPQTSTPTDPASQTQPQAQPPVTEPSAQTNPSGGAERNLDPGDVPPVGRENEPESSPSRPNLGSSGIGGLLPRVQGGGEGPEVPPYNPGGITGNIGLQQIKPQPPKTPTSRGNDADPVEDATTTNSANSAAQPPKDPGEYQITIRKGSGGGGGSAPEGNGLEALIRTASQQFQLGNYSAAATTYERALRSGGDAISINQRLGMTYSRLGRSSDAVGAFNRAVQACEGALSSGRGDKERIQNILDACKLQLKDLGN